MNFEYRNLMQIEGLITDTYIMAAIWALAFVGLSILISSTIAYEGGKNPKDSHKRKVWFWILCIVAAASFFCYNYIFVSGKIAPIKNLQDKFFTTTAIASGVCAAVYFIAGFAAAKLFKNGKFGTVFPNK